MARTMMPKSGVVMPYVVVSRDTTIAGVSTVDGMPGDVTLSNTYLGIAAAKSTYLSQTNADLFYLKKDAGDIKYLPQMDPTLPLNSGLKALGGNNVGTIDLIQVDKNNQIIIGESAKGVQGVQINSQGIVAIHAVPSGGTETVYPLYSTRARPMPNDVLAPSIGTYVKNSDGWITGVNITGINSDIKELRGLSNRSTITLSATNPPAPTTSSTTGMTAGTFPLLLSGTVSGANPTPSHARWVSTDDTIPGSYYFVYNNQREKTDPSKPYDPVTNPLTNNPAANNPPFGGVAHDYYGINTAYRIQTITAYNSPNPKTAYRAKNGDNNTWGRWLQYVYSDFLTPPAVTGVSNVGWSGANRSISTQHWFTTQPDVLGTGTNTTAPWGMGISSIDRSFRIYSGLKAGTDNDVTKVDWTDAVNTIKDGKRIVLDANIDFNKNFIMAYGTGNGESIRIKPYSASTTDGSGDAYLRVYKYDGTTALGWVGNADVTDRNSMAISSNPGGNVIQLEGDGDIMLKPKQVAANTVPNIVYAKGGRLAVDDTITTATGPTNDAKYMGFFRGSDNGNSWANSANLNVNTWWGFGICPSIGTSLANGCVAGKPSFLFDARSGDAYFRHKLNVPIMGSFTTDGLTVSKGAPELHWYDTSFGAGYRARMFINLGGGIARMYFRAANNAGGAGQGYLTFPNVNAGAGMTIGATSDERLKKDIKDAEAGAIERLAKLRPVTFNWKVDPLTTVKYNGMKGLIAQEAFKVDPTYAVEPTEEWKDDTGTQPWQLNESALIADLVLAIRELKAEIEELKKGGK